MSLSTQLFLSKHNSPKFLGCLGGRTSLCEKNNRMCIMAHRSRGPCPSGTFNCAAIAEDGSASLLETVGSPAQSQPAPLRAAPCTSGAYRARRRVGVGIELKADGEDRPEQQSTTTPEPTATGRARGPAVAAARASQPWPQRRTWLLLQPHHL